MKARNISQVNRALKNEGYNVLLVKGEGYFYVWSEDLKIQKSLSHLEITSIYVCYLNQQTIDEWVADVKSIVKKINQ